MILTVTCRYAAQDEGEEAPPQDHGPVTLKVTGVTVGALTGSARFAVTGELACPFTSLTATTCRPLTLQTGDGEGIEARVLLQLPLPTLGPFALLHTRQSERDVVLYLPYTAPPSLFIGRRNADNLRRVTAPVVAEPSPRIYSVNAEAMGQAIADLRLLAQGSALAIKVGRTRSQNHACAHKRDWFTMKIEKLRLKLKSNQTSLRASIYASCQGG